MVHSDELSKLGSLHRGGDFTKEKLATSVSGNGSYTDPTGRRRSKRFKAPAETEFPPDYGTVSRGFRSRTTAKEVRLETCKNKSVSEDCVPSTEDKLELIHREKLVEQNHLKSVDEKLCNCMDAGVAEGAEPHRVNMLEPMKDRNVQDNTSVLVKPPSISLSEEDVVRPVCKKSVIETNQVRGRMISIVRDSSSNMRSEVSISGKTVESTTLLEEKKVVFEKSGSRNHLSQSLAKTISPEVLEPLELDKSKVIIPKPIEAAGQKIPKEGVIMPLKPSEKMIGGCGEGSTNKNSETLMPDKGRLAQNTLLSNGGLPSGSISGESARYKVKETLRLFHGTCRKVMQEVEARPRKKDGGKFRVDSEATKILKSQGKHLSSGTPVIGTVPGVEVGDEFQYRMELTFLGIHRPNQSGIDYIKDNDEELVATSIVSSGGYDDVLDNSDVLIYTGQGGNLAKKKQHCEPKDQQLVTGNLALKNSIHKKNTVRVIRGKKTKSFKSSAVAKNYVYDGLYLVEEYWQEIGSHGKLVFKFKLRRMPGQPELSWKVVEKSKRRELRAGLCNVDISEGKEKIPICAVNDLDEEKPPLFTYTVKMIYPDWCRPIPPVGCGCTKRCTESKKHCACIAKNGGELPYNYDGAIVRAKPLVYECGPHCKCPPSCYLRVAQRGIKFQLEIFKTESRGWGVRSLESIPSGSFICEYVGELLEDKQAERLTGKDEYLFNLGKEEDAFAIDAARKGNIGRFINHSCSPNLYAQDVLYDHEEVRIPHVMFFAQDNIPPLEELTYHYNYKIDQVRDSNGNIKKKNCYCGSAECSGRLY